MRSTAITINEDDVCAENEGSVAFLNDNVDESIALSRSAAAFSDDEAVYDSPVRVLRDHGAV